MTYTPIDLISFIILCVTASVIIVGAHIVIEELWFTFKQEPLPSYKWLKPIASCVTCMASVWGSLLWFGFGQGVSIEWPFFLLAVAYTNTLLNKWAN